MGFRYFLVPAMGLLARLAVPCYHRASFVGLGITCVNINRIGCMYEYRFYFERSP